MKTILITAIGGDLAQSISKCILDSFSDIKIIGSDLNRKNSGDIFVEEIFILPMANHSNYYRDLTLLIKKEKIDAIIPCSEEEIKFFATTFFYDLMPKILGINKKIWSIGHDKYETSKFLKNNHLTCPETFLLSELNKDILQDLLITNEKLILKPKVGSGSKSVYTISSINEISQDIFQQGNSWIIQEYIPPDEGEFTIAVSKLSDKLHILQLKRKLFGDSTGYAEVVDYESINNYINGICNCFNGDFLFNIQLRLKKSVPFAFEINPRFSSTVYARHLLGFPDLALWVSTSLDLKENILFKTKVGDYFQRFFSYKVNRS